MDPCISETAEGNLTKFGTGDYVLGKFMCAKFHKNRSVGFSPAHTQHVHPPMAFFFCFFLGSSIRLQPKPLNRFSRIIRQKNRFGPRKCLSGVKNFSKNFLTLKGGKNPLSHAFQWETKMPITFDPVDRSSRNLVYSIRAIGASMLYAHKPEIPKTKWPPTPSWIFRQI